MKRRALLSLFAIPALCSFGCSGSSSHNDPAATVQALDPGQPHYGHSNDEWGTLWWKWVYEMPESTDCIIPLQDPTGEHCDYSQSGDVFFLVGTIGGNAARDKCKVPAGKAIFFPILTFNADNGGVPADMLFSDDQLKGSVQEQIDGVPVGELVAEVDGTAIPDLGRFRSPLTEYSYTLPPEPNFYNCAAGAMGVTGTFKAFEAGFYVMVAPLAAGAHKIHFAGHSPKSSPDLKVDVSYQLTVQ